MYNCFFLQYREKNIKNVIPIRIGFLSENVFHYLTPCEHKTSATLTIPSRAHFCYFNFYHLHSNVKTFFKKQKTKEGGTEKEGRVGITAQVKKRSFLSKWRWWKKGGSAKINKQMKGMNEMSGGGRIVINVQLF